MRFACVNSAATNAPFFAVPAALASSPATRHAIVDTLMIGMIGAGHGLEALCVYLGLARTDLEDRIAELGLPRPHDRPLRQASGKNPWKLEDLRRLMALWLENVSVRSIADAFGRSPSSIRAKRRRLGLQPRERALLRERSPQDCLAVILPWPSRSDGASEISLDFGHALPVAPIAPPPAKGALQTTTKTAVVVAPAKAAPAWRLGRDREKDMRFSILGFAGLKASAIAARVEIEYGLALTVSAVNNRLSRLQIVRERKDMIAVYDAALVERRAKENMDRLGASLRECAELHRDFWYCRKLRGNRTTCREFYTKKFAHKQAERSCGERLAVA